MSRMHDIEAGLYPIGVALYGNNGGHQVHRLLDGHPRAKLVAYAGMEEGELTEEQRRDPEVRKYETLEEMLTDQRVQLVSLCSPRRADQAREAMLCMRHGKHVYAEKPCALLEEELDELIAVSKETGKGFREMAGTAFEQPYYAIRSLVQEGVIGEVVQVFAQKSYPYHEGRPQDEAVDGGLIGQNGIHAVRMIEHVAGVPIRRIYGLETQLGNPMREAGGSLHMASSMMMELENGGVASIIANYLNVSGFGSWGNEHLRIFGTRGFIEAVDGGARSRLVIGEKDLGSIDTSIPVPNYFTMYIDELLGVAEMPLTSKEELHCTRMVIRAKQAAEQYKLHNQK